MVLAGMAMYGMAASSVFGLRTLEVDGATYTGDAAVQATLGLADGANLFRLRTDEAVARLTKLPAVLGAAVEVALPNAVHVRVTERQPIVIWQVGDQRWLIDAGGMAFAAAPDDASLPVVDDRRAASADLGLGSAIDAVVFDAGTRLASLKPADVGSAAPALHVAVDDDQGFTVTSAAPSAGTAGTAARPSASGKPGASGAQGWTAIFGFYTPTLRRTDLIPGQVRLLRSLLAGREAQVVTVLLSDESTGTYTIRTP